MEIPKEVRDYLEGLLSDAGMTALDQDTYEEMIKELYARLDNYIASVMAESLPDEHFEAFIKMNEEKKPQAEVEKFLKDKVPDVENVFAKAFADFRAMYLGGVTVARNAPQQGVQNTSN